MNQQPFSLRIFVADGDPDGLRLIERSNWIGKAVLFPRPLLPKLLQTRSEFAQTGVYLLLGPRDDGDGEMLYIGEGDPVGPRLQSHYGQKDFWSRAVFFVASNNQLNKAHVQFLEAQLISRALTAKRLPLDNINQPSQPTLSEADRADMQVFLDNLLGMLPVLGIHAFDAAASLPASSPNPLSSTSTTVPLATITAEILICKGKGVTATAYESTQGFVVKQGSEAVETPVPSMQQHVPGMFEVRQELIKNGVLLLNSGRYVFTQDYPFTSPSTAAAVILGRSANGRIEWKNAQGETLKKLQLAAAALPLSLSTNSNGAEDLT